MSNCQHKYLIASEPQFIPNYQDYNKTGSLTYKQFEQYVAVEMFECFCCGKKYSKECVPINSKIIKSVVYE